MRKIYLLYLCLATILVTTLIATLHRVSRVESFVVQDTTHSSDSDDLADVYNKCILTELQQPKTIIPDISVPASSTGDVPGVIDTSALESAFYFPSSAGAASSTTAQGPVTTVAGQTVAPTPSPTQTQQDQQSTAQVDSVSAANGSADLTKSIYVFPMNIKPRPVGLCKSKPAPACPKCSCPKPKRCPSPCPVCPKCSCPKPKRGPSVCPSPCPVCPACPPVIIPPSPVPTLPTLLSSSPVTSNGTSPVASIPIQVVTPATGPASIAPSLQVPSASAPAAPVPTPVTASNNVSKFVPPRTSSNGIPNFITDLPYNLLSSRIVNRR